MIQVRCFDTPGELSAAVALFVQERLQLPVSGAHPKAFMFTGGKTPRPVYKLLTDRPFPVPKHRYLLLSDERMVSEGSADRNFIQLQPLMKALQIEPYQQLFVDTTLDQNRSLTQYQETLECFFNKGGSIDTAILGLGQDGHIAGLFTREDLRRSEGQFAVPVERPDGLAGISVTPNLLRQISRIVLHVSGTNKREAVKNLLKGAASSIASLALEDHPSVALWIDRAAYNGPSS